MLGGLALRIGMTFRVSREDSFAGWDGHEYYAYAQSLLHGQWDNYVRISRIIRPPFYPIFLTPFAAISSSVWPIQIFQCVLGVLLCFILAKIASQWRNQRTGEVALVLGLLNPFLIYYCSFVLTETLFMTLLWLALLCLLLFSQNDNHSSRKLLILAAVLLGLACLTRPALQPFLVVALLWIGWVSLRRSNALTAFSHAAIFTVAVSILILPFMIRNWRVHGDFSIAPYGTRLVHAMGNSPDYLRIYRSTTKETYYQAQDELHRKITLEVPPEVLYREANDLSQNHPTDWWILQAYKFKHFWTPWLNPLIFPRSQVLLSAFAATPLFLLALCELYRRCRRFDRFLLLLLGLIATGYIVGGLLFHVQVRYRIPFVDISFLLLTASFVGHLSFELKQEMTNRFMLARKVSPASEGVSLGEF
jgi:4-amino-4-deoxy-L-arabinose transferase-like glycosyltransferase